MSESNRTTDPKLFTEWYGLEYEFGSVNVSNYVECASYLEGLADTGEWSEEAKARLQRCISMLRSGGRVVECLNRYSVRQP